MDEEAQRELRVGRGEARADLVHHEEDLLGDRQAVERERAPREGEAAEHERRERVTDAARAT